MYTIGETIYDSDMILWETKVGTGSKMTLLYSVWGKTEAESKERADFLVKILSK
jgi:hypothetical protein